MLRPDPASLNFLAIIVASLAAFFLGAVWYTALFGKAWRRLSGYTDEQMQALRAKRPMPVFFAGLIVCYIIAAAALALLAQALGLSSPASGWLSSRHCAGFVCCHGSRPGQAGWW